jgi:hypothetical protein
MSSSYITYKGRGFEAKDAGIELWLAGLGHEIAVDEVAPDWLKELGEYWCGEAVECWGCAAPRVEEELEGRDDISPLITIARRALQRIESMEAAGETQVSIETFGLHSDEPMANQPGALRYVVEVGRAFAGLLDGTLPPDDYPYPIVAPSGVVRSPQHPKGPQVAHGDRKAYVTMQLPVPNLEEGKDVVSRLFGISFTRSDSPLKPPFYSARGADKFELGVNSSDPSTGRHYGRHYQHGAIMLEIETTVLRCAEYERLVRSHFGSLPTKVLKTYFES